MISMVPLIACVFLLSTASTGVVLVCACILYDCRTSRLSLSVLSLRQTVPPEGVAVCPDSTIVFTCTADNDLRWIDLTQRYSSTANYTTGSNPQTQTAGAFRTELTDISGNTITSTATIDSVRLNADNMRTIACTSVTPSVTTQRDRVIRIQSNYYTIIILIII